MAWYDFSEQELWELAARRVVISSREGPGTSSARRVSLGQAWRCYQKASDGKYSRLKLAMLIRSNRIVADRLYSKDGEIQADFAVEFCLDDIGPYLSMLYLVGNKEHTMSEWMPDLIRILRAMARDYTSWLYEPRLYIGGRKGWRRYIEGLGIEMDERGFVHGWQEAFRNG